MLSEDTDYIKTDSFIHLVTNLWKMFSFLKQDLKILASFLSMEDNTEDMWSKQTLNK